MNLMKNGPSGQQIFSKVYQKYMLTAKCYPYK